MEARLSSSPGDTLAALRLADALLRQTRVLGHQAPAIRAERVVRELLVRDAGPEPGLLFQHQARRLLAAALASQHKFPEAIREAERCLQARPDDAMPYGIIGDAKLELGDPVGAFAAFDRMAAIRPDAASYARVALARELSGDVAGAIALMSMAIDATSPNDLEALAWHRAQMGTLLLSSGRRRDAAREFDHAIHLFPGYPPAVEGQARVAQAGGDHARALALLDQLDPGTPTSSALELAAEALQALGRKGEASRKSALAAAVRLAETSARPGAR